MVGIVSYGAYIPIYRMSRDVLSQVWGGHRGSGEKAVANFDEDTITMAVEAARDSLTGMEQQADGLLFASTTPPYREKQCASIIAAALDIPSETEFFATDFTNSLRSGTIAMRAAIDAVGNKSARRIIVAAADCRLPAPQSEFESLFGDGAAAFIYGDENVIAEVEGYYNTYSEFMDTWRKESDRYPLTWEDRFILEEGYEKHLPQAIEGLMSKLSLSLEDFSKFVVYAPNARSHARMMGRLGLKPERVQSPLFQQVGHTGCALVPMMLVAALEEAKPGDRILVANYSDGVDAYSFMVTDQIKKLGERRGIKHHLESKMMLVNYGRYLRFRDLIEAEVERRSVDRSSLTVLWRERNQILRFHGGRCKRCGTIQYPIQRVCAVCQAKDEYEEVRLADKKGVIFTYSMDERGMVKDLPNVVCIVDFEGGGRYYGILTDRDPEQIEVGLQVEMTLRNLHDGAGIHNYCWKARLVRA